MLPVARVWSDSRRKKSVEGAALSRGFGSRIGATGARPLNIFTNYFNIALDADVDFPHVALHQVA
jgi:hypothetical protein